MSENTIGLSWADQKSIVDLLAADVDQRLRAPTPNPSTGEAKGEDDNG